MWFQVAASNDHLVMSNIATENPPEMEVLIGKSSINGPFSMAIVNEPEGEQQKNTYKIHLSLLYLTTFDHESRWILDMFVHFQ